MRDFVAFLVGFLAGPVVLFLYDRAADALSEVFS